jgi:sarcosine oxidase subunit beta
MRVVVIGSGIIGASVAFHLAGKGAEVVVVDRGALGGATTAVGAGGVRRQFADPEEERFAVESRAFYFRASNEIGDDCDLRQVGFLSLVRDEEELERTKVLAAQGRLLGVDWRVLSPEEIARLAPDLNVEGVVGGSYTPDDGTANSPRTARAFLNTAARRGAELREHVEVTGFIRSGGVVAGVETAAGRIECDAVVMAAGPWAAPLGRLAGLDLPVVPVRRHMFTTSATPAVPDDLPPTFDPGSGAYVRKEAGCCLISAYEVEDPGNFSVEVDAGRGPAVLEAARALVPAIGDATIASARAGLREKTPDDHALIGPAPGVTGLFLAVGFSGHGFTHAPAVGRALAELIVEGRADPDLELFRPERFPI